MTEIDRQVIERIEELAEKVEQRSWIDRIAIGVLGSVITAALIGVVVTVISLTVSNTELAGKIDRLADRLAAAVTLLNRDISGLSERHGGLKKHVDTVDARVRDLERASGWRYRQDR